MAEEAAEAAEWVRGRGFGRVALQVPAARLGGAAALCREVARASGAECFVLADTSYGECCVDELCAGHLDADCVVHFGEACLSPTQSIPALCVLERAPLDVGACAAAVTAGLGGEEEDGAEGGGASSCCTSCGSRTAQRSSGPRCARGCVGGALS